MNFFSRKLIYKTALLMIIIMLLSPLSYVFAEIIRYEEAEDQKVTFFEAISNAINYMQMDFLKIAPYYQSRSLMNILEFRERDKLPTGELVEQELSKAIQALNNFGATVLKDEKLANAVEDILSDFLDKDDFTGGVWEKQDFVASIIKDERLINIIGEVIADYLKDEKMAEDIELFFNIALDLIADKNIQNYIKETLARLVEDGRTSRLINGIIAAAAQIFYNTATDAIVDITSDNRIKEVVKDMSEIFLNPIPDIIADIVEDERVKNASEDLLRLLLEYGPNVTAEILEDNEFQSLVSDVIIFASDFSIDIVTTTMREESLARLVLGVTDNLSDAIGGGTLNYIVASMVDDFFKSEEFRAFADPGFQYLISESRQRARDNTEGDSLYLLLFDLELNLGKEIAWGVAEVPPEIIYLGFFDWMVYGKDDLPTRTYTEWAAEFSGLITKDFIDDVGAALAVTIGKTAPNIIDNNKDLLFDDLMDIVDQLPFEETADIFREDEALQEFPDMLAKTIIKYVPFENVAETLREDDEIMKVVHEVFAELVDVFPLKEVGDFIKQDNRITDLIDNATPELPLTEIANLIRTDDRLWDIITELANTFPVKPISQFLQGELRADIIGHTIADLLLNLVADFLGNSQLTDFAYEVLTDIMHSFDEPIAKIILENAARFLESEEIAPVLSASVVGVIRETEFELHEMYKEIVPKFFTRMFRR